MRQVRDFTVVHASLDSPSNWGYVLNKFDAMASFSYQFTQVCFFGHTHVPRFYVKGLAVAVEEGTQITIEPGRKYFVNVGSVGQPRDGDWRAAYVLYDMVTGHISLHRVEYDIVAAQKKILAAGLPVQLADRLALGK